MQQFLPFLRLDGYYILSDLTGVPDMFQRLRPTLRSLLPWRRNEQEVEALKPWVRWAITGWVIALIPIMLGTFGLLLFNLPRMAATAWDSFWIQTDRISDAWAAGALLTVAVASMQALFLVLPVAGITATFSRVGGRIVRGGWSWSSGVARPPRRDPALRRRACGPRGLRAAAERRVPADPAGRARNDPGRSEPVRRRRLRASRTDGRA